MSIGEAMSVGLPALAGRATGGVAWQLDEGRAGLLVDVTDAQDMADAIVALSLDRARWQAASAAARARARQLFAIDDVAERYMSLYRSIRQETVLAQAAIV